MFLVGNILRNLTTALGPFQRHVCDPKSEVVEAKIPFFPEKRACELNLEMGSM